VRPTPRSPLACDFASRTAVSGRSCKPDIAQIAFVEARQQVTPRTRRPSRAEEREHLRAAGACTVVIATPSCATASIACLAVWDVVDFQIEEDLLAARHDLAYERRPVRDEACSPILNAPTDPRGASIGASRRRARSGECHDQPVARLHVRSDSGMNKFEIARVLTTSQKYVG
jgi:hypothetical protein